MNPVEQLTDIVTERMEHLHPATGLHPLHDDWLRSNIANGCMVLVAQLNQTIDDQLAAKACIEVMRIVWPVGDPDQDADWWTSPLGRLCARSFGNDDSEVSHSVAASMLGLARGSIGQYVARGDLVRHPDGGVLRSSVLQRLAR